MRPHSERKGINAMAKKTKKKATTRRRTRPRAVKPKPITAADVERMIQAALGNPTTADDTAGTVHRFDAGEEAAPDPKRAPDRMHPAHDVGIFSVEATPEEVRKFCEDNGSQLVEHQIGIGNGIDGEINALHAQAESQIFELTATFAKLHTLEQFRAKLRLRRAVESAEERVHGPHVMAVEEKQKRA